VWNKICEFLESKDGEIRHKSEANGKASLGWSRAVIGCRTNDDDMTAYNKRDRKKMCSMTEKLSH
jgi:hypothetical protein